LLTLVGAGAHFGIDAVARSATGPL
jgi:hypothetical protein